MKIVKTPTKKKIADIDAPQVGRPGTPFRLSEVLERRLPGLRKRPKRQRSRAQILYATARMMEQVGYDELTVDLIVEAAGMARGTFYLHYKDRSQAAMTIVRMYNMLMLRARPRGGRALGIREAIARMNAFYIRVYAMNARLLSGRESLLRARPEYDAKRDLGNFEWAQTVLRDVHSRFPRKRKEFATPQFYLKVRAVIAMADEMLREIYIYKAPSLVEFAEQEELLVDVLTDLWYLSLYAPYEAQAPAKPAASGRA